MKTKTHLGVPSILIVFFFISVFWYLVFNYFQVSDSYLSYLVWATIGLTVVWFCKFAEYSYGRTFNSFLGAPIVRMDYINIVILVTICILTGIGSTALLIILESTVNNDFTVDKWNLISSETFSEVEWIPSWIFIMILTSSIIVPITEELIFRGLILNRLRNKYGIIIAVIVSSLIFATFHLNKSYIGTFLHGIIFALVAIKFASLYYPIVIHSLYNLFMFLAQKYLGLLFIADIERINEIQYWIPELSCLVIGLIWSIYYFRNGVRPLTDTVGNND